LLPVVDSLRPTTVLVVADSVLQWVPFAALPLPGSGEPLVVGHEVVHLPSASVAAMLQTGGARKEWSRSVAVFGDPVFEADDPRLRRVSGDAPDVSDRPSTGHAAHALSQSLRDVGLAGAPLPRLLEARREAKAIAALAPDSRIALDFAASRAAAVSPDLAEFRIVHFATHGVVDDLHPELSGIVLSMYDDRRRPQDGFLRLHDIANLSLPVDLVVLSACNTALGKEVKGEGLIGLVRGFMYAGSRGVLATLWRVDDEATSELMTVFYKGIFKAGLSPSAALRGAQLALLKTPRWHHPRYWASFVLEGDWH
jgi:CHAT domain-containing protein